MASPLVENDIYAETLAVFDSADGEPLTTPDVADALDIDRRTVYARLERLAESGDVKTKKVGAGGRVWWRPSGTAADNPGPREVTPVSALLGTIGEPALATDTEAAVTCANDPFCDEFGYDSEEIVGTAIDRIVDGPVAGGSLLNRRDAGADHQAEPTAGYVHAASDDGRVPVLATQLPTPRLDDTETIYLLDQSAEQPVHRSSLGTLSDVQTAVLDIVTAILSRTTRDGMEETVCTGLAETDIYEAAWIAEVDPGDGTLRARADAGTAGYPDAVEISTDPSVAIGQGPAGRAVRTKEIAVCRDIVDDPAFEPWRNVAREQGFRSGAAVPIVHESTLYGVLLLYTTRENAFDAAECRLLTQLGEIVGYAIATAERKRAMMSDELVEIGYRSRRFLERVTDGPSVDGEVELERIVPVGDDTYLAYGCARNGGIEILECLVEAASAPQFDGYTVLSVESAESQFELRLIDPPMARVVSDASGAIDTARLVDGDLSLTVHLPPGSDVQAVTDAIQAGYPHLEPITRKQRTRGSTETASPASLLDATLTDRQRGALEAGYAAGFFEWPRDSSGKEVAASLGISPATFHQHVRTAERKILDELLDDRSSER